MNKRHPNINNGIDTFTTVGLILMHIFAIAAFWHISISGILLCIFLYWLTGWFGITIGYHRLLTHDSFETPRWFKYLLTINGVLALQRGPLLWCGEHKAHHQQTDTEHDPYSTIHGFAWAHVLWICFKPPADKDFRSKMGNLAKDKFMIFIDRYYWIPQIILTILLFVIAYAIGGMSLALSWVLWGVAFRTVAVYHATWFVNSASHTWGYRSPNGRDSARNLWWVALLTGGEGWHGNHHERPNAANHGWKPWEIDPTYWTIVMLSWIGLASNIKKYTPKEA